MGSVVRLRIWVFTVVVSSNYVQGIAGSGLIATMGGVGITNKGEPLSLLIAEDVRIHTPLPL